MTHVCGMTRAPPSFRLAGCVFLAAQSLAIVTALTLTTVANVALLINTSPAFTALLDYFFLREAIPLRTKLMMLVGRARAAAAAPRCIG